MNGPRVMCAACGEVEIGIFSPACEKCVRKVEAEEGICAEPGECFVAEEDREPPTVVGIFDGIPNPRDPYGCENPVSQEDSGE